MFLSKTTIQIVTGSLIALSVAGCTPKSKSPDTPKDSTATTATTQAPPAADKEAAFRTAHTEIVRAINEGRFKDLTAWQHPTHGFFFVHNPGVFTVATHYQSFAALDETHTMILSNHKIKAGTPKEGKLPYFDCDKGWDKEGCFTEEIKDYDYITKRCANYMPEFWEDQGGAKTPQQMEAVKAAQKAVSRGLLSTEEEGFGFYMGYENGKWYLLVLDLVEPCSA